MSGVVIIGAQWGDEGKGKIVDLFTERADVVVRFAGGPNAGHTLVVGGEKLVVRLTPSGVLRPQARCVMAQGMVVDPWVLLTEIDMLEARGIRTAGRLFLSDRAHVVLPYHILVDGLREERAHVGAKIGTTKRGIGPAYEDKAARRGLRAGDLRDPARVEAIVRTALAGWEPVLRALGGEPPTVDEILSKLGALSERIVPMLADTSLLVDAALRNNERVLFEGAQGTLLDLDHGTYPFVTSSTAVAAGACVGAGIGPTRVGRVLGVTKGYATRVGEGPFPTELFDATGERIRTQGGEFGSVTGRPRRTGWLDLPGLRYAARVNGLDSLAVTKLDVLSGLEEISVCVAYDTPQGRTSELPVDAFETATPVYEKLAGWPASIRDARTMDALPAAARAYLRRIEEAVGVPIDLVSVGPDRDATIVVREVFV
ncbi:MAG: adenylosuccinate synthase [Polyangiaceae bacterium]